MPRLLTVPAALTLALVLAAPASAQRHHQNHGGGVPVAPAEILPDDAAPVAPDPADPSATDPATTDPAADDPAAGDDPLLPDVPAIPVVPVVSGKMVPGVKARMRADGKAAVPRAAPVRVRAIIRAANAIVGKPYLWGGGHQKIVDKGYDCSGAVSYALIGAGQLRSPLVSGDLAKAYAAGAGRYVTIYANRGHVYMEVAGLRLDTSSVGDPGGRDGVRWRPVIGRRVGFHVRHLAGL